MKNISIDNGKILYPYKRIDKWGFVDENYEFVIDHVFDEVFPFTDGLAKVKLNNRWNLIDKTGRVVIKLEDENFTIQKLSEELIIIGPTIYTKSGHIVQDDVSIYKKKGSYLVLVRSFYKRRSSFLKYGVINENGDSIIDFTFDKIEIINQYRERDNIIGFLVDRNGKKGFIGINGQLIIECAYSSLWIRFEANCYKVTLDDEKEALYDIEGKEVASPKNCSIYVFDDKKRLFKVVTNASSDNVGFLNSNFKLVIPPIYNEATDFVFGLSVVRIFDKSGVIDISGKIIVPIIYGKVTILNDRVIRVTKNGKSGLLTLQGAQILPNRYSQIEPFISRRGVPLYSNSSYLLEVCRDNWIREQVGLYDPIEKKFLIDCDYSSFEHLDHGIFKLSRTVFFDRSENEISNNPNNKEVRDIVRRLRSFVKKFVASSRYDEYDEYEENESYSEPEDERSYTSPEERQCNLFVDEDPYYEEPSDSEIAEGYFMEEEGLTEATKTSIFSLSKKEPFLFPYDDIKVLNSSFLAYKRGVRWGILDLNNSIVTDPIFDKIEEVNDYLTKVMTGTLWQVFIFSLSKVKSKKYITISKLCGALLVSDGNKWGVLDKFGNSLIPLEYDRIAKLDDCQYFKCEKDKLEGIISNSGKLLVECKFDKILGLNNDHLVYHVKSIGYGILNLYDKSDRVLEFSEVTYLGYDLIGVSEGRRWGVANIVSGAVSEIKYDERIKVVTPELIEVSIGMETGLISLVDGNIIPCIYQRIEIIGEGRALASERAYPYRTKLYDLNLKKELLEVNHRFVHVISESLIEVDEEERYILYDFDGNLVVAAYDNRSRASENSFILFRKEVDGSKYALIDKAGKYIIDFGIHKIEAFDDHIKVGNSRLEKIGDKIDLETQREEIQVVKYGGLIQDVKKIHSFSEGFAKVIISSNSGKQSLIDKFGDTILPERMHSILKVSDTIYYEDINGWHMIDEQGNHHILPKVEKVDTHLSSGSGENLIRVKISNKWGVWDIKMREIVPILYEYEMDLINGLIKVSIGKLEAVYNSKGELIVPLQYEDIQVLGEDIIIARNKENADLYDNTGVKLTSVNCKEIKKFGKNVFAVFKNSKWAIINRFGELFTSFIYDDIVDLNEKIYAVQRGEYWGIINNLGKVLIPCSFDYIKPVDFYKLYNVYEFSNNGDLGLLNDLGEIIISPQFFNMEALKSGNIVVKKNWKYGLINRKLQLVIPAEYDSIKELNGNPSLIEVTCNHLKGIINDLGEPLYEPQFNEIEVLKSGNMVVRKNNKCGLVDTNFKICIPIEYDRIYDLSVGSNLIFVVSNGLKGIFDVSGKSILEPKYKDIEYCNNNLFRIGAGSTHSYYVDSNGKVLDLE